MKILLSAIPFDNGKSGISVYIPEVVKALEKAGHELTLIVEDDGAKEFERFEFIGCGEWNSSAERGNCDQANIFCAGGDGIEFDGCGREVDCLIRVQCGADDFSDFACAACGTEK